ncbi:MAG TPA: hypothetical protein PL001_02875 [Candidatus Kryptobacter bacterium]|nr:hypothetical protein [Candidatus Kryptobacter bacterium]
MISMIWLILLVAIVLVLIIRNRHVYDYRDVLIQAIAEQYKRDIDAGKSYDRFRWDLFRSVDYNAMVFSLMPLRKFYNIKEFELDEDLKRRIQK